MKLPAFDTYCLFFALRNHFTQEKYDYFKYKGKLKFSKDSFLCRKDRFQFQKLSRKYDENNLKDFIIANIIVGKVWPVDFLMDDADENYSAYLKRKQSLSYIFDNEIQKVLKKENAFKVKNGQYPEILNLYFQHEISIETMAILNAFIDYVNKFDKKIGKDDVIWNKIRLLIAKLTPFLDYDKEKIKNILKTNINSYLHKKESSLEKT